jgi:hypothetical protein
MMRTQSVSVRVDEAEDLFEMANLRPHSTGLPMVIWVSEKGHSRHGPRIKVGATHSHKVDMTDAVSVSIGDVPEVVAGGALRPSDFRQVAAYIKLNQGPLLDYWHGEMDTADLMGRLLKLTSMRGE